MIASTLQVTGIATFLSGIRVAGIATVGVLTVQVVLLLVRFNC